MTNLEKFIFNKFKKGIYLHYFIAGFVDGEGSFNVSITKQEDCRFGYSFHPKFQVYQHKDHQEILEAVQYVFRGGRIDKKTGTDVMVFNLEGIRNLKEKVIPFFSKYQLIAKKTDFQIFCQIVVNMEKRIHWTKEGFKMLVNLIYELNKNGKGERESKENILRDYTPNSRQNGK